MRWTIVILLVVLSASSGLPQNCEGNDCDPVPDAEPEVTTTSEPDPDVTTTTEPGPDNTTDPNNDDQVDMGDADHHHHHDDMDEVEPHHYRRRRQAEGSDLSIHSPEPRGQVAFTVQVPTVFRGLARMRFGRVLTNVGGGWNQREAEFVAPYTGGYFFTFHVLSDLDEDFTLALFKNRDHQVTAYGSKDDYQHASNSVFLKLNRRDRVYLELQEGRIFEHPHNEVYTTFTGFMLYRN